MRLFFFDVADDGDKPRLPDHMGTEHPSQECIPAEAADLLAGIALGSSAGRLTSVIFGQRPRQRQPGHIQSDAFV
jgi:hypothetical protein